MPDYLRTHYPNHPSLRSARDSAPKAVDPTRDRATGRYTYSRFKALCVCGHPLGIHTAAMCDGERPCLEYDCECERYRKSRRKVQRHEKTPKSEPFLEELRELGLGGSWIILQKDSTTWYGPYETEDQGRDRLGRRDSLGCAIRGRVVQVPKYAPLAISKTT